MIKETFIPTINISSLINNKFETNIAIKTMKKIEKACIDVGFFQVVGHGINLKEINKTCAVGYKFFNSSSILIIFRKCFLIFLFLEGEK